MHACARVGERKGVEREKEVLCLSLSVRTADEPTLFYPFESVLPPDQAGLPS